MKLGDVVRSIELLDIPEAPSWVVRVIGPLNRTLDRIISALSSISLSDNVNCEVIEGRFTHTVVQKIRLKRLQRVGGGFILNSDGYVAVLGPVRMTGVDASLSVYFNNPNARNVRVAIVLFPEGLGSPAAAGNGPMGLAAKRRIVPVGLVNSPDGTLGNGRFKLPTLPADLVNDFLVIIDGRIQQGNYTVTGLFIDFTVGFFPITGSAIEVIYGVYS